MKLILFIHENSSQKGWMLKNRIVQNFGGVDLQILSNFNALKERLKSAPRNLTDEIFILLADTRDRLNQLIPLIGLLENRRIILILPDETKETLSSAVKFFPRFFTPISDTYNDLCDVLTKIINQEKTNINNKGGMKDVSRS